LQPFLDSTKNHYGASLTELDIAGETEKSRQTINSWVEKETRNKIRDLLKPGTLQPDNRLVLTNAIYFKGNWAEQFDAKRTLPNDFHLQDGKSVKVPMMNANLDVRFFQTPEMKMVELPYQGKAISMLCIMPTKKDGLPELQKKLTAETMNEWTQKLNPHVDLRVSLPKFKIESQFGLAGVLSDLGMKSAFNPNTADFSGMTREERLFISAVIHKAFVEVNEEGTEAAAATAVLMAPEGIRLAPPEFVADRPFVFVIRENKNGAILFVGRLNQPN
jgi:serpin B